MIKPLNPNDLKAYYIYGKRETVIYITEETDSQLLLIALQE